MAARKGSTALARKRDIPEGFKTVDLRPKRVEVEAGLELQGALGAVSPGKGDMPAYRTIKTEDGLIYLPSHAALRGLLDFPTGTEVYVRCEGGSGKKGDPWDWTIAIKPNGNTQDEDLPF